jgi:signal transduction histidine kinase
MRKLFRFNYESDIRLSFLLLILFFVLINYGIAYLLNLSRNAWEEESLQGLKDTAYSVSQLWQNTSETTEKELIFKNMTHRWGVKRIDILKQNGEILFSSDKRIKKDKYLSLDTVPIDLKSQLLAGKGFVTEVYPGKEKDFYQSYFYPFVDRSIQGTLFVRVEKEVTKLFWVERILRYEGLIRGFSIFLILLFSFILLKNIFSPFQKMKRKAEEEKIITSTEPREDVETVVDVFQKVIAELKEKEKKLQKLYIQTDNKAKNLERYNEYILKSINNGVIICDNQGRIVGFNQAAQNLLGPSFKLSLNLHYKEVLGEESKISKILDEVVVRKNLSRESEVELKGDKSEVKFLMADCALLRDEGENILGLVLVLTDLTELKKIQQEIALKQKMASLGEISAGLAHELRNSMGALLGYCRIMRKGIKQGSALYPIVESITAESLSLENLLKRFLDFAKPLEAKWMKFDLVELIQDNLKSAMEKKAGVKFYYKPEGDFKDFTGDALLLRQVFQNLLQNSIEAVGDKGEIRIFLQRIEENGEPFIKITIQDNGSGIPEENLENIFKPFFTSKEKGIGLGLSLVKKIIDLHKGRIEVESEPGKGTIFSLFLPLNQPQVKSAVEENYQPKAFQAT